MNKKDIRYIAVSVSVLLAMGVAYIAIQQNIRLSANETPVQLAEDTARALETAPLTAASFAGQGTEISQSLAPFAVIYDASGTPIAGSGKLRGKLPTLPAGVLDSVRTNGESRITWQPEAGVRSAIAVAEIATGTNRGDFVMVGRSLREVEKREDALTMQFCFGALAALIVLAAGLYLSREKQDSI